ncbi:MAG TPA: hypothetical protein ENN07_05365 [candidate division Zixibacteria bacterium]|nr:hypothetical protein [candidate division Zixibacteria bacterium]
MRAIFVILLVAFSISAVNVILDPGHGGTDPGATGPSYTEKQAVLDVAFFAKSYLESAGVTVGMTRSTDITLSLADRTTIANSGGWDRFMSIHENAFNTAVQGTETFCHPSGSSNSFDLRNKVQPELIWAHGYNDRGTKTADFYVLRNTTMPAILGEGTFIDYTAEWDESWRYLTNWNDHSGRQGFAYAKGFCIHAGITPPTYGEPPPVSDSIIVDDADPEFTIGGAWSIGSYAGGWEGGYHWCSPTGEKWARWTPNLPEAGEYSVYMWWLAGANRCDSVFIRIFGVNNDSMFVSQKGTGSEWHYLGNYDFHAGTSGYVSLGDRTAVNGTAVIADAVLWIHNGPLDVAENAPRPQAFNISAYPNPFNGNCRLQIDDLGLGIEAIEIYDVSARRVACLGSSTGSGHRSAQQPDGTVGEGPRAFPLDGISENGSAQGRSPTTCEFLWTPNDDLPSGVYLVRATAGGNKGLQPLVQTKRVVYLK